MTHIDTLLTASNGLRLGHLNGTYFLLLKGQTEWRQIPPNCASCYGAAYKWFNLLSGLN